jgi:hypothetical protein
MYTVLVHVDQKFRPTQQEAAFARRLNLPQHHFFVQFSLNALLSWCSSVDQEISIAITLQKIGHEDSKTSKNFKIFMVQKLFEFQKKKKTSLTLRL